ncbi:MAG: hypothetical protein Q4D32_06235 [Eubacteriales bacterium]|nr:hypothetical protein [Eubacteriales bacterium]
MEIEIRRGASGIGGFLMEGVVFLVLFVCVFLLSVFLPEHVLEKYSNVIALIALGVALLGSLMAQYGMERFYGATKQLVASFDEDSVTLRKGQKEWRIPYQEIKEVVKVMAVNRFFDEKGCYRVTIKRKRRRAITFWTTDQEYREHMDFEETQLYSLYVELRSRGVKCC